MHVVKKLKQKQSLPHILLKITLKLTVEEKEHSKIPKLVDQSIKG